MNGVAVLVLKSFQPARPARYREGVSALLATPLLEDGQQIVDRDAQKARVPTCGEYIGNLATGVLYHFHCGESLHGAALEADEQTRVTLHDETRNVEGFHEGVIRAGRLDVLLDGGPQIGNEVGRYVADHGRLTAQHFEMADILSIGSR
jgi:hypothetical protein